MSGERRVNLGKKSECPGLYKLRQLLGLGCRQTVADNNHVCHGFRRQPRYTVPLFIFKYSLLWSDLKADIEGVACYSTKHSSSKMKGKEKSLKDEQSHVQY